MFTALDDGQVLQFNVIQADGAEVEARVAGVALLGAGTATAAVRRCVGCVLRSNLRAQVLTALCILLMLLVVELFILHGRSDGSINTCPLCV